jgi:hypothetical protein
MSHFRVGIIEYGGKSIEGKSKISFLGGILTNEEIATYERSAVSTNSRVRPILLEIQLDTVVESLGTRCYCDKVRHRDTE